MSERRTWTCYRCGQPVISGMKFTFTSKGPIHWECFRAEVKDFFNGVIPEDVNVLLELIDYLNEGIIKAKELEVRASDSVRQSIVSRRKVFEGEAARLMKELDTIMRSNWNRGT
ncbi:DUF2175 domain-containing protein [Vulcanisaeta thermophila]|uniref:DUF2175 domain-containing protein n=1 Tax=Vulcanisaeta thermophila TaxID=867917 RepID=UPI000853D3D9|nr:DUF2175 domain-containing protein [Vulcanisaeta thermophila]